MSKIYHERVAIGLCGRCGLRPPKPDKKSCAECIAAITTSMRAKRHRRSGTTVCYRCGRPKTEQDYLCSRCKAKHLSRGVRIRHEKRVAVLSHYSEGKPNCSCCHEDILPMLTIDHINSDGSQHRQQIGNDSYSIVKWLLANNLPDGFRVLCHNCNFASYQNGGVCPHQAEATL